MPDRPITFEQHRAVLDWTEKQKGKRLTPDSMDGVAYTVGGEALVLVTKVEKPETGVIGDDVRVSRLVASERLHHRLVEQGIIEPLAPTN